MGALPTRLPASTSSYDVLNWSSNDDEEDRPLLSRPRSHKSQPVRTIEDDDVFAQATMHTMQRPAQALCPATASSAACASSAATAAALTKAPPPLLSATAVARQNEGEGAPAEWLGAFEASLRVQVSRANLSSVMRVITALASGTGLAHPHGAAPFMRGQQLRLEDDLEAVKRAASEWLPPADDSSRGRKARHPLSKLIAYKAGLATTSDSDAPAASAVLAAGSAAPPSHRAATAAAAPTVLNGAGARCDDKEDERPLSMRRPPKRSRDDGSAVLAARAAAAPCEATDACHSEAKLPGAPLAPPTSAAAVSDDEEDRPLMRRRRAPTVELLCGGFADEDDEDVPLSKRGAALGLAPAQQRPPSTAMPPLPPERPRPTPLGERRASGANPAPLHPSSSASTVSAPRRPGDTETTNNILLSFAFHAAPA